MPEFDNSVGKGQNSQCVEQKDMIPKFDKFSLDENSLDSYQMKPDSTDTNNSQYHSANSFSRVSFFILKKNGPSKLFISKPSM